MEACLEKETLSVFGPSTGLAIPLKVLFIGTDTAYCRDVLKTISARHPIAGIVCPEPPVAGPLRKLRNVLCKSLRAFAAGKGMPYFGLTERNVNALGPFMESAGADIACILSLPMALPPEFFGTPRLGSIGMHPSLLPKYRGPNPFFWQYFYMEEEGGVTVFVMDDNVETGDILAQASFPIRFAMEPAEMVSAAGRLGSELLSDTLDRISSGNVRTRAQRHLPGVPFARKVRPGEALVNCHKWPPERVYHVLKGSAFADIYMPKPRFLSFLNWRPVSFSEGGGTGRPGEVKLGARGFYITLPEGRIHIAPDVSPAGLYKAVGRLFSGKASHFGGCPDILEDDII